MFVHGVRGREERTTSTHIRLIAWLRKSAFMTFNIRQYAIDKTQFHKEPDSDRSELD